MSKQKLIRRAVQLVEPLESRQLMASATTGDITGQLFRDRNGNGVKDGYETNITGNGTVIYADRNNNGAYDAGTDTKGNIDFYGNWTVSDLAPGQHVIRQVLPTDQVTATTPARVVTVVANRIRPGGDHGQRGYDGVISGYDYVDADRDGIRDAGEHRNTGAFVFIDVDNDGAFDAPVGRRGALSSLDIVPSYSGDVYTFANLTPGTYVVRCYAPSGYSATHPATLVKTVTVERDQLVWDVNFGYAQPTTTPAQRISGSVFADYDRDGVRDRDGAPEGDMVYWDVYLDLDRDAVYDANEPRKTTDPYGGGFTFDGLTNGTYRVRTILKDYAAPTTAEYVDVTINNNSRTNVEFGYASVYAPKAVVDTPTLKGTWNSSTYDGGFYGAKYFNDGNTGKGTKTATYDITPNSEGHFQVFLRWTSNANRATNVPIDIVTATGTRTITVNQQTNGGKWVPLGTYYFKTTGGKVVVRTDGTNGFVVADAMRLFSVQPTTVIKDNSETTGVTRTGTWNTSTSGPDFLGLNYLQDGNTQGGKSVKFASALTGGVYEVFGWWTAGSNRASNARFDVTTGSGAIETRTVNQRVNGGQWVSLGFFNLGSNAAVTIRNDGANGYVIADAVKFVRVS